MRRRGWRALALVFLCAGLLSACGGKTKQVRGLVTQLQTDGDGGLTAFVVRTDEGEQVGVLLSDETLAFPPEDGSWSAQELRKAFQAALREDVQISADCLPRKQTLTALGGETLAAYEADYIRITGRLNRGAAALRDGTAVDVLEEGSFSARTYRLSDGTELLRVNGLSGPEHHYVAGLESFDDLSGTAREKVSAFYEERGALYDEAEELERAYAGWKARGGEFRGRHVSQDVSPSASSGRVMYFLTEVMLPLDHGDSCTSYTLRLGDAFDRETGEHIDNWELFTAPAREVVRTVLNGDRTLSADLRAEMEAAFRPERVTVFSDGVSVDFEPGSLPSQEHSYILHVDIGELAPLMQPWAVPDRQN